MRGIRIRGGLPLLTGLCAQDRVTFQASPIIAVSSITREIRLCRGGAHIVGGAPGTFQPAAHSGTAGTEVRKSYKYGTQGPFGEYWGLPK